MENMLTFVKGRALLIKYGVSAKSLKEALVIVSADSKASNEGH